MSETPDILLKIAADRAKRVALGGAAQGLDLPVVREAPLVNFRAPADAGTAPTAPGTPAVDADGIDEPEGFSLPAVPPPDIDMDTPLGSDGNPVALEDTSAVKTGGSGSPSPGILIAEVKRKSPSKGDIAEIPDPAEQAARYNAAGFQRISVLTEEARFGGSLADLVAVKTAHPHLAVLRKDFLLGVDDIDVSYRAGADAVLLIATLLDADVLEAMYRRASELGLTCLVEVHASEDVDKVRPLAPPLVGINSRDLRRFKVEPLLPLETRSFIDWPCDVIYESGLAGPDDARFVRGSGFSGFLVGEAVAKDPEMAPLLLDAWNDPIEAKRRYGVWEKLYGLYDPKRPFVKICGITNRVDAEAAVEAGADIIGFILAESPRRTVPTVIRACADLPVLKAAVVVLGPDQALPTEVGELLGEGALDFVQFHGFEGPDTVRFWPSYKVFNLKTPEDAELMDDAGSPAVLVDAFSQDVRGGTGKRLDPGLVEAAAGRRRLWLAGGLTPENVGGAVSKYNPALVDVSSGVEAQPGLKDHEKIRLFIEAAKGRSPESSGGQQE